MTNIYTELERNSDATFKYRGENIKINKNLSVHGGEYAAYIGLFAVIEGSSLDDVIRRAKRIVDNGKKKY